MSSQLSPTRQYNNSHPFLCLLSLFEFFFKETCHLRQEMFGSMTRLSDKDYDSIYASTGLDADGRMQNYALYNSHMEIYIRAYAKFAKCVPGFNLLDIQDQVTLIKCMQLFKISFHKDCFLSNWIFSLSSFSFFLSLVSSLLSIRYRKKVLWRRIHSILVQRR